MSGNICEWTNDSATDYSADAAIDPAFPPVSSISTYCIIRGGSWKDGAITTRSAFRDDNYANSADHTIGFSCVVRAGK